jgi:hypothetical protein
VAVAGKPAQQPKWDRLVATATAECDVSDDSFPAMVEEIERRLGIVGHVSVMGGTLTWSPATQGEESRKLVVQVSARDGGTAIRIQEDLEVQGLRKLAPPAGILVTAGFALAWASLLGVPESVLPVVGLSSAVLGAFLGVRTLFWSDATSRGPALQELANALAELAAAVRQADRAASSAVAQRSSLPISAANQAAVSAGTVIPSGRETG